MIPTVEPFFDRDTFTLTYIVWDAHTKDAVIIDPVWNYDQASSTLSNQSVDAVRDFISKESLKVHYIMETHAHADHISGAQPLKDLFPFAPLVIGQKITLVQRKFAEVFNLTELATNGEQFDILLNDGDEITAGSLTIRLISTPGHTPACSSYLIGDAVFTGDALFMPDSGTGRCDFPLGSAEDLYDSIHNKLYRLPDSTRVFTCHDYQPGGRELQFQSTIGEQKRSNIQLKESTTKEEYVGFRTKRDATLATPRLLYPSVQMNINAGKIPAPESNNTSYLKTPVSKRT